MLFGLLPLLFEPIDLNSRLFGNVMLQMNFLFKQECMLVFRLAQGFY